jgi:hypothetical protein
MSGLDDLSDAELMQRYELSLKQPTQPKAGDDATSGFMDMLKSAGIGVVKGGIGLVGLPGNIASGMDAGLDWLGRKTGRSDDAISRSQEARNQAPNLHPTSATIQRAAEGVTGPFYDPQTTPGKYSQTVGEGVPAALAGPGGVMRNLFNFALLPGMTSETVGEMPGVKGTKAEPWMRAGTALATGGVAGMVNRPNTVATTIGNATQGVTQQQAQQAEQLFMEAQRIGAPVTRAEALQQVTGGATGLSDVQRVVEGSGALKPFMAERPGQVRAAGDRMLDTMAPPNPNPSMTGSQVGAAAEETLDGVRQAINRATRPAYDAAGQTLVPQNVHAQRMSDPLFTDALNTIRNNPAKNAPVRGQSDRSVAVYDAVMKELRERSTRASNPVQPGHSQQVSTYTGNLSDTVRGDAIAATGGATGAYNAALTAQAQLRQQYLEPLQRGPLGKLAGDPTTERAIEVLFPRNPLPGSAEEVTTAVRALVQRNPAAARDLVTAHVESVFNQATRDLKTAGANQFGGAGFAAALRGNGQQAANLESAVRALPNGNQTWQGIDRFLTIMEAQGMRPPPNSATAFNHEMQSQLRRGGPVGEAITLAAGGGLRLPARAAEAFQAWQLGNNVQQLARLFTDPQAGRMFRDLVGANGRQAEALVGRISLLGANQATQDRK